MNVKEIKKGFTHSGVFHADDVFATALLKILNPDIEISRGFVVPEEFDGIVYDIGRGEFDHHQEGSLRRENGTPYAAFGLLWRAFGNLLLDEADAEEFDKSFIEEMDLSDNTGKFCMICQLVRDRNPDADQSEEVKNEAFFKMVDWAKEIIEYRIENMLTEKAACEYVKQQMVNAEDHILCLDKYVPWKKALAESDIKFVIYKSERGGYVIQAVPVQEGSMELKKAFPEEWRGKNPEILVKMTGVSDVTFCHNSGFLVSTKTVEGARKIAKLAMEA